MIYAALGIALLTVVTIGGLVTWRVPVIIGERDAAIRLMQAADADRLHVRYQLDRCRGIRR